MVSQQWYRALGIGIPSITALVLLGITKIFDATISTNLFNTGVTIATILGIANALLAWAVYKNRV